MMKMGCLIKRTLFKFDFSHKKPPYYKYCRVVFLFGDKNYFDEAPGAVLP